MSSTSLPGLRPLLLVLVSALFVMACAKDSPVLSWDPLSPAERELRERVEALQDIVWEGTTVTAIAGALLGGALGGAQGAARGAEVGRLAGAGAGRYVAWQQGLHEDRVALLRAVTADLETVNAKTAALVESMRAVVAQRRMELARRKDNIKVMKKGLATAEAQQELARKSRSLLATEGGVGLEPVDEQIAQHERHIADIEVMVRVLTQT